VAVEQIQPLHLQQPLAAQELLVKVTMEALV
jgi:hypothetical protein